MYNLLTPNAQLNFHSIRSGKSWSDILKDAKDWINSNINIASLVSINTLFCHNNYEGMVTIFYYPLFFLNQEMLGQTKDVKIQLKILRDFNTWNGHFKNHMKEMSQIQAEFGKIIAINSLQVNQAHQEALTVVWYQVNSQ